MTTRERKLAIKLRDRELAKRLVAAGLDTPAKIKAVSNAALKKAAGGQKNVDRIRERIPKTR